MRKRKAGSKIFDITEVQDDELAVSEVYRATNTFSGEDLATEVSALRVEVKQINQTQVQLAEAVSNLAMQVAENREIPTEVKMAQHIDLSEPMEALLTQLVSELQQIQEDVRSLSSAQTQTELALSDVQISTTGEVQALRSELGTVLENFFQKALKEGAEMIMPADNTEIEGDLIQPVAMEEGLTFAIREGGRTIGSGRVTQIIME